MNTKLLRGISLLAAALALVLTVANIALINSNRAMQDNANKRQKEISDAAQLGQLNQALVQSLAELVVNNNDSGAKELLSSQGITINAKAAAKATPAPAAAPAAPAKK